MKAACLLLTAAFWAWCGPAQAGSVVEARCEACGYASGNLFLFGGKALFRTVCLFPALCAEHHRLVLVNLLGDDQSSKDCPGGTPIPYTDARLAGKAGANIVASWNLPAGPGNPAVLTDGSYLCPRCGAFGLRFRLTGLWD